MLLNQHEFWNLALQGREGKSVNINIERMAVP